MRLQYISSACVLIEHAGVKVLCDPWLTDGIYGGAWYHNPPLTVRPEDFPDIDYLYISHCHPDHLDWPTLERLPRVPVLIGAYVEDFMGKQLRAKGFETIEMSHGGVELCDGFGAQVIPADDCDPAACGKWIGCQIKETSRRASYQIDTLAVFTAGTQVIVNVNDCPYELAKGALERVVATFGTPDLLCVGYAGAGPWPQCFSSLSTAEKKHEAEKKYFAFIQQMRAFVNHLQPKRFLPFAGQYTLGGALVDLNDLRGVPELDELPDDPRMVRLNRNAWFDCETGDASEPWIPPDRAELVRYRETLRSKPLDHEADPWPTDLPALFREATRAWVRRCAERGIATDSVSMRCVAVYPDGTHYSCRISASALNHIEIRADARLWRRVLTRQMNANNAEVGSLFTYDREGEYSRPFMNSLSYFHV